MVVSIMEPACAYAYHPFLFFMTGKDEMKMLYTNNCPMWYPTSGEHLGPHSVSY